MSICDTKTAIALVIAIVDEKLSGQGVARKLVDAGVAFAREKSYKIIPQCSYANAVFNKTPEYADVWAK